jgi:uncharacterized flavoprotein (TIGR03862 family)
VAADRVIVVGGGPAGLMAADVLSTGGAAVEVFDAMPSVGRKLLLAGRGGLNLTHSEPLGDFLGRYEGREALEPALRAFGPEAVRAWAAGLGVDTFVGSSGRIFPTTMKAAPLLRAWLHRLRERGERFAMRHRCIGLESRGEHTVLRFETPDGTEDVEAATAVLALGGASWPRLGSDAAWTGWLAAAGTEIVPLGASNCGFDREGGWSEHFRVRHAGQPLKNVRLGAQGARGESFSRLGECVVTESGIEGSLVYAASALLSRSIAESGRALVHFDLLPARTPEFIAAELARPRGARSWATHLKSRLGLAGVKVGLLRECLPPDAWHDPQRLTATIKALPLALSAARPVAEAISSAGGVAFGALDEHLMFRSLPGVFCAGEMLDWDAPTGGYLLTACLATGAWAARGALARLRQAGRAGQASQAGQAGQAG